MFLIYVKSYMFLIFAFYTFSILSLLVFHCRLLGLCWHWNPNVWEPWGQPVWFCNLHNHSRYLRDRRPCTVPEVGMTDVAWLQVIVDHCCILSMSLLFASSLANTSVGWESCLGHLDASSRKQVMFPIFFMIFPPCFEVSKLCQWETRGKTEMFWGLQRRPVGHPLWRRPTHQRGLREEHPSHGHEGQNVKHGYVWLCMYGYVMYTNPFRSP